ncbi:MAG: PIN domain-containing protein, partial [Thermoanaerobaculia bacterium]
MLVRYLVEDDANQAGRAVELIEHTSEAHERLFVPQIVLCELVWVLESSYRFPREQIVGVLGDLLRSRQLVIEDVPS